jgi:hypothetical protein
MMASLLGTHYKKPAAEKSRNAEAIDAKKRPAFPC